MANYETLAAQVAAVVKTNGSQAITGANLQAQLLAMIASLGANYQYAGVAIPSTDPGTPDQKVFYIAATAGTYTNFGGIVLADGEVAVIKGSGSSWTKEVTGVATAAEVSQLGQDIKYIPEESHNGYINNLEWTDLNSNQRQHKIIDIDPLWVGKTLNIKSNTIAPTDLAFLSSYNPVEGEGNGIIDYHGGIASSFTLHYTIPNGTTCIYLLWVSGTMRNPVELSVDGINLLKDVKGALNESVQSLMEADSSIKKQVETLLSNNQSAYKSDADTLSDGIPLTDSGFIEMVLMPIGEQVKKCLFDVVGTIRFYMDINPNGKYIIKVLNNSETLIDDVAPNRKVKIRVVWDGITDSSKKVYNVYINETLKLSGTYTGSVTGDFKIKNEGSWSCLNAVWYYVNVNGVLLTPNNTFDIVYGNYDSSEEIKAKIEDALNSYSQDADIIRLNPDVVTKIANSARSYHYDESGETVATKPLVLLHFSDIHGDSINLDRLLEFADDAKISPYLDDILHTGDVVTEFSESISFWTPASNVLNILGNHEYWGDIVDGHRTTKTPAECYAKFIEPYKNNWAGVVFPSNPETGKSYWYKDYSDKKVRLIGIDYKEIELNPDSTQLDWMVSVMNETLNDNNTCYGYHIVIAAHNSAFRTVQDYKNPFDSIDILSNADGRLEASIANSVSTFIGNGGKFVCYLAGHNHTDHFGLGVEYPNQLNIAIATASSTIYANTWEIGRVLGTKSQDLFNIVSIDTYCSIIKLIRVGCDTDRQLRHKDTLCFYYGNEEFDSTKTYARGKIVMYNNELYQFVIPHTGEWSNGDVNKIERMIEC